MGIFNWFEKIDQNKFGEESLEVGDRSQWERAVTKEQYDYDDDNPLIFKVKDLVPHILDYLNSKDYSILNILEVGLLETPFSVVECQSYIAKKLGVNHFYVGWGWTDYIESRLILNKQLSTLLEHALSKWPQYTGNLKNPIDIPLDCSRPSPLLGEYGKSHQNLVEYLIGYFNKLSQESLK